MMSVVNTSAKAWRDPDWSSLVFLSHFDGADAATTFVDSSPHARTITAVGNAQIDTAQSKFGGSSLLLDGTGDCVTIPNHADLDFGSGDFVIDMWIRPASSGQTCMLFAKRANSTDYTPLGLYLINGELTVYASTDGVSWDLVSGHVFGTPSVNQWSHVRLNRYGELLYGYLNGVGADVAISGTMFSNSAAASIGANEDGSASFDGHIDEYAIWKGISKPTADFPPPGVPWSQ